MTEINWNGKIVNGILIVDKKDMLEESISAMYDCEVEIVIRKKIKRRSFNQNAYYWAVVIPAVQQGIKLLGQRLTLNETESWLIDFIQSVDKDFAHLFLKQKFIERISVDETTGEIVEQKQSTRLLNKEDFSEYIEKVIQFANEVLEIEIPESI